VSSGVYPIEAGLNRFAAEASEWVTSETLHRVRVIYE